MTTSKIGIRNPFRRSSKLYYIFEFMKDGAWHDLKDITEMAYGSASRDILFAGAVPLFRRRTASALRTIRKDLGVGVGVMSYNNLIHSYRMVIYC